MKFLFPLFFCTLFLPILSFGQLCPVVQANNAAFNWKQDKYTFYLVPPLGTLPIDNPFTSGSDVLNVNRFRDRNGTKDFEPADGWNLVQYDFGRYDATTNVITTTDIPWILLYNKYESILRVFMWIPDKKTKNTGKIDIAFSRTGREYKESALLSHVTSPSFALDNFEKGNYIRHFPQQF